MSAAKDISRVSFVHCNVIIVDISVVGNEK